MAKCAHDACGCREVNEGLRVAKERSLEGRPGIAVLSKAELQERYPSEPTKADYLQYMEYVEPDFAPIRSRKDYPVATGVLDYFPRALTAVALCSKVGNDQHNPGEPLHWAREKSTDDADAAIRHFLQRGSNDDDGVPHMAKAAWRFLAVLEKELESSGFKLP